MVPWRSVFLICLAFSLATLIQRGSGDLNDFNLRDALKETASVKRSDFDLTDALDDRNDRYDGHRKPRAGGGGSDFDLTDALDDRNDRYDGHRKPRAGGGGSDFDLTDALDDRNDRYDGHRKPRAGGGGSDFDLTDALDDRNDRYDGHRKPRAGGGEKWDYTTTTTKRPGTTRAPAKPAGSDFDLTDALDDRNDRYDGHRKPRAGGGEKWDYTTTTTKRPGTTRAPAKPAGSDFDLTDALDDRNDRYDGHRKPRAGGGEKWDYTTTTTKRPGTTRAPAKPAGSDFDLTDALDDRNDRYDGHRKPSAGGGGFSDKDLEDVLGGGDYKPDKGRGDGRYGSNDDSEAGMSPETGTIAGVASALAMALIGAVSSYISYQQKKFCFRIQHAAEGQEGLNADYVKGENLEAVVCEEPQVKYSALPPQSAEPPQPQPPRI